MKSFCRGALGAVGAVVLGLTGIQATFAEGEQREGDVGAIQKDAKKEERLEEVLVQSSPLEQTLFESAQPVAVLSGEELTQRAQTTLGETLSGQPGITASTFGAGSSRPVIRGLGGERIRILENGVGSQDVSNTSPDHLTTVEPTLADKIEVLRGPATLLYGTNAVGGIVNIFDNRIPEELPDKPLAGTAQVRGETVDKERSGTLGVTAPVGPFAFNFNGFTRRTDDYDIPGYARTGALRETPELDFGEPRGRLPFSSTDTQNASAGSSYIFDKGFFGFAVSEYNSNYGVPNGEENISIDAQRQRLDVRGKITDAGDFFEAITLRSGLVDYDHTEFEGDETGTKFSQDSMDNRLEFSHRRIGSWKGVFGAQLQSGDLEAVGKEAYQPPTQTDVYSLFVFEDYEVSDLVSLQMGLRYDRNELDSDGFSESGADALSRSFDTFSQSGGVVWKPIQDYAVALSLTHTERAPSGQELFSNGAHIATASYEIGDENLDTERSLGIDLNVRKEKGFVRGFVGGFYNKFWDFISLQSTGDIEDDFPVFRYTNVGADFIGFESQISLHPIDEKGRELSFDFQPDYVRATDRTNDDPLARITPFRIRWGANFYDANLFRARLEVQHVFEQDRTADFETATSGYTFLNAFVSREFAVGEQTVELFLRGTNLLDDKAREHTSFIKDVAPLPGASVMSGIQFRF